MAIYIEVTSNSGVTRTTERLFETISDALAYLGEFRVPLAGFNMPVERSFSLGQRKFVLSHTLPDILTNAAGTPATPDIEPQKIKGKKSFTPRIPGTPAIPPSNLMPDNEISSSVRDRLLAASKSSSMRKPGTAARSEADRVTSITPADTRSSPPRSSSTSSKSPPTNVPPTGSDNPKEKLIPIKAICQKLNLEPRIARGKLRKLYPTNDKQRWEWTADNALLIEGLLK